ncbi:NAD(P) transhydrogenase subunit alpha [Neptunicella marina]|uniref:proton-translocating NAD(P)(+) transhydrogenase n=1 Tax=Neptunicella marina TaxID=2125989 RepID=A0A8J6IQ10_9ALTE|nr:NAD(P) transhydrogenase subunit alpha [Neptunicella marina]MBC3765670.1 NAD(P) transhydrogenase subunit alpha [Neptunicella marina]
MPRLVFVKETVAHERRCALVPEQIKAYLAAGADVWCETGLGQSLNIDDETYIKAGAQIASSRDQLLAKADVVCSVQRLPQEDLSLTKTGAVLVSFLDPFNHPDYLQQLCQANLTGMSMEMIPRISRCQKMDALSSQASLAGYVMVLKAASQLPRVLPMMMTPAGTLKPAKVFVIGAGVAGLQAIATAKRLGVTVTAFDTRAVVAEQVQSLGAKFLSIDLGETGQTEQGYARQLTPQQMQKQQQGQADCIADSDIVITTAQLFGRKPPRLIDDATIARMKPGSVIVDMAAESGGNVEGSIAGEVVYKHGVSLIGSGNWASDVARDASQMYAANLFHLLSDCFDLQQPLSLNFEDEVVRAAVITHQGAIVNEAINSHLQKEVA